MTGDIRRQIGVLGVLLAVLTILSFVSYAFIPLAQLVPVSVSTPAIQNFEPTIPFAIAAALAILLVYGATGLAGFWFARKLGLPGIYREQATWRNWLWWPMLIGLGCGAAFLIIDTLFAAANQNLAIPHPGFPLSLIASATAGIGEEILFRSFVLGLWAFILVWLLRRWRLTRLALWLGVAISALAFAAMHLPAAMFLFGAKTPTELPAPILAEIGLLNTLLGVLAGERYLRDGLVAAIGVHFWADIVWHVMWPALR